MTDRVVAFDVETPNNANDRMSAIGITVVENGVITREMNTLINTLDRKSPGLRHRIFGALQRADVDGFAPLPPRPKRSRRQTGEEESISQNSEKSETGE